MKKIPFGVSGQEVSAVALGCMRMSNLDADAAAKHIACAVDLGVNFFDHADIYGGGVSEEVFSKGMKLAQIPREKVFLQSKCAIVPGKMYDFSKEHIISSVEGSLRRLDTDHLDALLLHRPDALMEPEEVAEAFCTLRDSGKVQMFGVSNHNRYQLELLEKYLPMPLMADQLQFGLGHTSMVTQGLECNMYTPGAQGRDGGVLDYCRLKDITIQTWSPFQHGMIRGSIFTSEAHKKLNEKLTELAADYGVTESGLAVAWILRHPAKMQLIAGTMNPEHLSQIVEGTKIELSRVHWYELYLAAGNILP